MSYTLKVWLNKQIIDYNYHYQHKPIELLTKIQTISLWFHYIPSSGSVPLIGLHWLDWTMIWKLDIVVKLHILVNLWDMQHKINFQHEQQWTDTIITLAATPPTSLTMFCLTSIWSFTLQPSIMHGILTMISVGFFWFWTSCIVNAALHWLKLALESWNQQTSYHHLHLVWNIKHV